MHPDSEIPSQRASVRPFELADASFLREAHNDRDVQSTAFRAPVLPRSTREFEQRIHERFGAPFTAAQNASEFAIVTPPNPDPETIGVAGLYSIDFYNQNAEVGVSIASAQHRQLGYGTDGLLWLVELAFQHFDLHRLYCFVKADNGPGQRLAKAGGFSHEATLRAHRRRGRNYLDVLVFTLFASHPIDSE